MRMAGSGEIRGGTLRVRRIGWQGKIAGALTLCACLGAVLVGANISSASGVRLVRPSVLNEGFWSDFGWDVAVNEDGPRAICMAVAIYRRSGTGPGESAQCSAPAFRRGNTRSLSVHTRDGGIGLTVFGAAFDSRIGKVQVVMLDGRVKELSFRKPHGGTSRNLSRFKYVALAVHGPWCIAELITRDRNGREKWRAQGDEVLPYSAEAQCPRRSSR